MKKYIFEFIFYASLAVSLALEIIVGPAFGGTDVYIFKDAGCNFGLGHGFQSSLLPGYLKVNPELFSSYAPGLPYLFGIFTKFFGCTGFSNLIFNWISASLASVLMLYILPSGMKKDIKYLPIAFILGFSIWKGNFEGDRPEILSLLLFLILCRCAMSSSKYIRDYVAPLTLGFIFLVHPYAGVISTAIYGLYLVCDARCNVGKNLSNTALLRKIIISGFIAFIPIFTLFVLYFFTSDINSLLRFLNHASIGSGSIINPNNYFSRLKGGITSYGILAIISFVVFMASMLTSITYIILFIRLKIINYKYYNFMYTVFAIIFLFPIILYPGQNNYWEFSVFLIVIVLCFISSKFFYSNKILFPNKINF